MRQGVISPSRCHEIALVGIPVPRWRQAGRQRHRAVATRYDKLAVRYEATVLVEAINEWL